MSFVYFLFSPVFLPEGLFVFEISEGGEVVRRVRRNGSHDSGAFVFLDAQHGKSVDHFVGSQGRNQTQSEEIHACEKEQITMNAVNDADMGRV